MATPYIQAAGVRSLRTLSYKQIFADLGSATYAPTLARFNGSLSRDTSQTDTAYIAPGMLLGKITASGLYRPSYLGVLGTATTAATVTSITVPAAVATEVARLITVAGGNVTLQLFGPPTAGGTNASTAITVTAASGTTLTVSSVTTPVHVVGSVIRVADGAGTPTTIFGTNYGTDVLDTSNTAINQHVAPFVQGGLIDVNAITFYSSMDASVKAAVKTALKAVGTFRFTDDI